jgi:hypothetical protein
MTPQLGAALLDDLAFLRKFHFFHLRNWRDDPPLEEVRRGSVMLRRWLADRELVGAWRRAGFEGEPRIAAIDLAAAVAARGAGVPDFALAGAATYNRPATGVAAAAPSPAFRLYPLGEYLESPSIYLRGKAVSRREIVCYTAQQVEARAQDRGTAERLCRLEARANAYRADAFMLELISIGQTLTQTPDVEKLAERLRSAAPGREG